MPRTCAKVAPAQMDKRVTLQAETQVSDSQGGFTSTWADGDSFWAKIEPLNGWQRMQAMQMQTPVTHKILIRYRTGITAAKRLKFGTRIFWIREVLNPGEANQFLEIKAEERA